MRKLKTVWRGSHQEALELLGAIARHCTCDLDARGVRSSCCPAHRMLIDDQRVLDGLLFARWSAHRFRRREFGSVTPNRDWMPYYFTPLDRQASTVEEFLTICQAEPEVAETHLRSGYFEPWLRDVGRADLASLARMRSTSLQQFLRQAAPPRTSPAIAASL